MWHHTKYFISFHIHCLICRWKRQGLVTPNSLFKVKLWMQFWFIYLKPEFALNNYLFPNIRESFLPVYKHTYTFTHQTHYRLFQGALYSQRHFYLQEQPSLHHERSLSQPKSKGEKIRPRKQTEKNRRPPPAHVNRHINPGHSHSIQRHHLGKSGSWGEYILKDHKSSIWSN